MTHLRKHPLLTRLNPFCPWRDHERVLRMHNPKVCQTHLFPHHGMARNVVLFAAYNPPSVERPLGRLEPHPTLSLSFPCVLETVVSAENRGQVLPAASAIFLLHGSVCSLPFVPPAVFQWPERIIYHPSYPPSYRPTDLTVHNSL